MKLTAGLRLRAGERTAYEVKDGGWTSPRHEYVRGRKVFWNFRYPADSLDEADAREWLDVLIRRPLVSGADSSRFEREVVFALPSGGWFLEPLDLLEEGPPGPEPGGRQPLLVLADPHAARLPSGPTTDAEALARRIRMATEVLDMLEGLHQARLVASGLDPGDFLMDDTGRWFYLGTDRIAPDDSGSRAQHDLAQWARLVIDVVPEAEGIEGLKAVTRAGDPPLIDWVRRCLGDHPKGCPASVADLRAGGRSVRGLFGLLRPR
jgi:hypothetical protein